MTSVELVEVLLGRIAAIDAPATAIELRSVLATSPTALADAAVLDTERANGQLRSPLHGIPVLIKDNIDAVGLPGSAGSTALAMHPPTSDSELVTRLRAAGLIVLGATNLSQWANMRSPRSTSGWSALGGLTSNPHCLDRSAGGSSSGAGAALAAGLAPLAVGTETDGSITCPAGLNGVVGLKASLGTIPRQGIVPLSSSQDCPGAMARTVADVAALHEVLTGTTGSLERSAGPIDDLVLVVASNYVTNHPATDRAFTDAVDHLVLGAPTVLRRSVALPGNAEHNAEFTVLIGDLYDDLNAYLSTRGAPVASLEDVVAYEQAHAEVELAHFGHEFLLEAIATGGRGAAFEAARASSLAWAIETCLEPALADAHMLLAPSYGPAWKHDLITGAASAMFSPITQAAAIAGWPILCLPMAMVEGLPVGMAMVARPGAEPELLAVARSLEASLGLTSSGALLPAYRAPSRG